jgi:nucleotide-binding universal stress UspA family protein
MPIKSVWLGLNFEETALNRTEESYASERYAVELCAREQAHLSVFLAAPIFKIPNVFLGEGLIIPIANAPADEVNPNRRDRAEEAQRRIASAVKSAGVTAEFYIAQESYPRMRECLVSSAAPSDLIILSSGYLFLDRNIIDAILFTSGRPVVMVPPDWQRGARFEKVMVAWDGGGRAARAVGDAMPLLSRAEQVDIVCVSHEAAAKNIASASLAAHLTRHCKKVAVADLTMQDGSIAKTLQAHATTTRVDLLVMGAYAHPRMFELVFGGVTIAMLSEAELPLFLSH